MCALPLPCVRLYARLRLFAQAHKIAPVQIDLQHTSFCSRRARPRLWARPSADGGLFFSFFCLGNSGTKIVLRTKAPLCAFVTKWQISPNGEEAGLVAIELQHGRKRGRLRKGDPHGQSTEKKTQVNGHACRWRFALAQIQPLAVYCFYFLCYFNVEGENRTGCIGRAMTARKHFHYHFICGRSYCSRGQQKSKHCRRFSTPPARIPFCLAMNKN